MDNNKIFLFCTIRPCYISIIYISKTSYIDLFYSYFFYFYQIQNLLRILNYRSDGGAGKHVTDSSLQTHWSIWHIARSCSPQPFWLVIPEKMSTLPTHSCEHEEINQTGF